MSYLILPLTQEDRKLFVIEDKVKKDKEELELFLDGMEYMNSSTFSRKVLFSQEIKANNTVEGYNEDVGFVNDILSRKLKPSDKDKGQRIRNLYRGYHFIFDDGPKEINKENLKKLYSKLSWGLLEEDDRKSMGQYYRKDPVYIYYSDDLSVEPDEGIDSSKIESYMNEFFDYVNFNNDFNTQSDNFIKSQIMHYQFVNIHPYYDINGRTSRTVAMWYLLNNQNYPYIIFNRGISLDKNNYYRTIRNVRTTGNITPFLIYMLKNVKVELEKESIIDMISSSSSKLSAVDYQTLYYILCMNGMLTAKDFMTFYNNHNDKKKALEIYRTMLEPLLDKNIILKKRDTSTFISSKLNNFVFELNPNMYEIDKNKIKTLKIIK